MSRMAATAVLARTLGLLTPLAQSGRVLVAPVTIEPQLKPINYVVIASDHGDHKAGVPVDQAITQANWGECASWTLASSQGPIAIRKVYEELSGRLE